jgi:DNA-directed RNA polymerase subunit RPC12/RpoP
MASDAIACAACSYPVPGEAWNREEGMRCRGCGNNVRVLVFPAIRRAHAGVAPEALQTETEASCFYHPQSRAAIPCQECGRFLCSLCELEVDGRHICPRCFERVALETVETRRPMYDTIALILATFPAVLFWPAFVGAPWALFLVFRRWNAPGSVVPRTKIRFLLAALFALAELSFLVFIIYMLTKVGLRGPRR